MDLALIAQKAKEARGNWRKWEAFGWRYRDQGIEDPENWAIFYTHGRDSKLIERVNARVIDAEMMPFLTDENPDACEEQHSHRACGWVDGYSVRVTRPDGNPTPAFVAWCELQERIERCGCLDDDALYLAQEDAAISAIHSEGHSLISDARAPKDWEMEVYDQIERDDPSELEDRDGTGPYPSPECVKRAICALGWLEDDDGGYKSCACPDCLELAIGYGPAMCSDCKEAGCTGEGECQRPDAYGCGEESGEE